MARHPRRHRRLVVAGVVLALLALGATGSAGIPAGAVVAGSGSSGGPQTGSGTAAPGTGPRITSSFTISGSVSGLYPGVTRSLVLTVSSPQKLAITVTSIKTTVSAPSTSCGAANVQVTSFTGKLLVPAGGKAMVGVKATMAHSAPNACKGKVFPLHYAGVGTEA